MKLLIDLPVNVYKDIERKNINMCTEVERQIKNGEVLLTGEWIVESDSEDEHYSEYYKCPVCGGISYHKGNYCSDCGTKMKGE